VDGTAEEHLRIGALEDAGDAGAPLELLLDDRPDGLMSSLGILDLLLPPIYGFVFVVCVLCACDLLIVKFMASEGWVPSF